MFTLSNGLTIHLKEIHSAPIISQWVWYRVGSRNEIPGKTGISHWVEHMQFKGTQNRSSEEMDRVISRHGGLWNAMTYLDWTAYLETIQADRIDLAIELEADRMQGSLFDPAEVEAERTVILSEREGNEDIPTFRLEEAVQKQSFMQHPYRHEVIGETEDLHQITRDDLYRHYRQYYSPRNAVVCLAGDFETKAMLEKLEKAYGSIPNSHYEAHAIAADARLPEEVRLEVPTPGSTVFLHLAYRAPQASHPDFFAFSVLDSLLAGPSPLNMFGGGGISNRTSRMYRALVETDLAVGAGGSLQPTIDPYLYELHVTLHPEKTAEQALVALDDLLEGLKTEQVSMTEIARAAKQAKAQFIYGSENITNQAFWLGYAEMFDHYDWFEEYVERISCVTPEDVQRVARQYLGANHRVVGVSVPNMTDGRVP